MLKLLLLLLLLLFDRPAPVNVFGAVTEHGYHHWRKPVLRHMIQRAKADQHGKDPPPFRGNLLESYTLPGTSSKELNSSLLSPLLGQLVNGANIRFEVEYGLGGAGKLVTIAIRAMKAWSKGLEAVGALQHPISAADTPAVHGVSSSDNSSGGSAFGASRTTADSTSNKAPAHPPGYVWEIFVLFVLERRVKQCRDEGVSMAVYSMHLGAPHSIHGCAASCIPAAAPHRLGSTSA